MKDLLCRQVRRYPRMQVQDMVKLIYQNEFGGGHLIENGTGSLQHLKEECRHLEAAGAGPSVFYEDIGNGLCRLYLGGLQKLGISLETVNRFFVNTAHTVRGSIERFEEKLDGLRQCCKDGMLPYSIDKLEQYLADYREKGYPPVSHSDAYRAAYSPSYRIVQKQYIDYIDVFSTIDILLNIKETVNIAIDGNSGAGKSTLAALIHNVYDCNVFHMDHFFLRPAQRTKERLGEAGGNVDYERFSAEVLAGLKSRKPFQYRIFNCQTMSMGETVEVNPKRLNVIEGAYSMHPALNAHYHLKIFMKVGKEQQSHRILERNGPFLHQRFQKEWIPMENRYFQEMKIQRQSDIVLNASCADGSAKMRDDPKQPKDSGAL
ncbi:MAG: uridine kinase family protein [Christensenellales bacterium]